MVEIVRESLAAHLRSMSIDNFSISGNTVRIGRTHWAASICRCGDPACDGWALEPLVPPSFGAVQRR
ncbi:hypothetical protein AWL63_08305 [Sphingomonas panacis]|uniref:Uncharacterized protein n=1 Tax=Sphingomonas panacis TaxID=1560345 RepID=A0A1B3Z977_9SPHN|nr:hypothetical protein AWL63_08305 [Sphingomonas panacis]